MDNWELWAKLWGKLSVDWSGFHVTADGLGVVAAVIIVSIVAARLSSRR